MREQRFWGGWLDEIRVPVPGIDQIFRQVTVTVEKHDPCREFKPLALDNRQAIISKSDRMHDPISTGTKNWLGIRYW